MLTSVILILFYGTASSALEGKKISENVIGYLSIPYAKPPLKEMRFKDSEAVHLDDAGTYAKWSARCPGMSIEGKIEDCLFLNLLQVKTIAKKTNTMLIFSNKKLSEKKLTGLVSPSLNVCVASIRTGVLGSFGNASYGVSDVINAVKLLKDNADVLNIGEITVWAESSEAETVASALSRAAIDKAILINGNAKTRTVGRGRFSARAAHNIASDLECDLPSASQSMDCLRSKSLSELYATVEKVSTAFYPFGSPFRVVSTDQPSIPTILGVFKQLPREYPNDSNFDENYTYTNFKRALAGLLPESQHRNAPLLRKLVLHQYVYTQGDKKNTYFLFEQMRQALLDRDFIAPTQKLVEELKSNKGPVYLFEFGIDNPPKSCLEDGGWEDIKPFCDKMFQYFTRFAVKGQPTKNSCEPTNPTWPAMGTSKRDYHVILKADGTIEWELNFHLASTQLWNNLLPALDQLELQGRRDAIFKEETQLLPTELEDDEQEWHRKAAKIGGFEFSEEDALNDLPFHAEL